MRVYYLLSWYLEGTPGWYLEGTPVLKGGAICFVAILGIGSRGARGLLVFLQERQVGLFGPAYVGNIFVDGVHIEPEKALPTGDRPLFRIRVIIWFVGGRTAFGAV